MNLGETIKALRDEKRLSMRGLGKALDVSPMHISNIEKSFTKGSSELIAKIARARETDVDSLLHIADRVDPEVVEVIQQNPRAVPSFLRSARDLSADDWEKMQAYAEKLKKGGKSGGNGKKKPKGLLAEARKGS